MLRSAKEFAEEMFFYVATAVGIGVYAALTYRVFQIVLSFIS